MGLCLVTGMCAHSSSPKGPKMLVFSNLSENFSEILGLTQEYSSPSGAIVLKAHIVCILPKV